MLKKLIEEIRKQPDLYNINCWKYHLSGNVIELSVLPAYSKQKDTYRCSVISVGQVLNALSKKIEKEKLNFHIQSFPNIENPEIVATIRTDEKNEIRGSSKWKRKKPNRIENPLTNIKSLAEQYQLTVGEIDDASIFDPEGIPVEDYPNWIALYSTFNNPFTWLNIGYLKESLRNKFSHSTSNDPICIIDFCSSDDQEHSPIDTSESRYLQSLVGYKGENVSAG